MVERAAAIFPELARRRAADGEQIEPAVAVHVGPPLPRPPHAEHDIVPDGEIDPLEGAATRPQRRGWRDRTRRPGSTRRRPGSTADVRRVAAVASPGARSCRARRCQLRRAGSRSRAGASPPRSTRPRCLRLHRSPVAGGAAKSAHAAASSNAAGHARGRDIDQRCCCSPTPRSRRPRRGVRPRADRRCARSTAGRRAWNSRAAGNVGIVRQSRRVSIAAARTARRRAATRAARQGIAAPDGSDAAGARGPARPISAPQLERLRRPRAVGRRDRGRDTCAAPRWPAWRIARPVVR